MSFKNVSILALVAILFTGVEPVFHEIMPFEDLSTISSCGN